MNSPSLFPHPLKSKQKTFIPRGNKTGIILFASHLEPELQCKYTMQGRGIGGAIW